MTQSPEALRTLATHVVRAGQLLHEVPVERRARWLAQAFAKLGDRSSALGREVRVRVEASSGLSRAMVDWALDTTLATLDEHALIALERSVTPPRAGAVRARAGQLCVVMLAGNVFTAVLRGVGIPLLFGWPVLAKASSQDDAFAHLLQAALCESDPELGDAFRVVTFAAYDEARTAVLLEQADAVSVFGSDATLNEVRARLSATATFVGHGHGLGAAFLGRAALADEAHAREAAKALALDVAAYDQRGCLSPLVAWVEVGAALGARDFALLVHEALEALRTELPRGPLPLAHASAQLSWRGVGAIRGELFEGEGFSISYEANGALRVSPGYRNLQLLDVDSEAELCAKLAPLGVHLKSLGVAGVPDVAALAHALPARLAPRICPLGTMQTPPLDALHDGVAPWEGLVRWVDS